MANKCCVFAASCTVTTVTFLYFPFVSLLLWRSGGCGCLLVQPGTKGVLQCAFQPASGVDISAQTTPNVI